MSKNPPNEDDIPEYVDEGFWDSETNPSNTIVSLDAHVNPKHPGTSTMTIEEFSHVADVLGDAGFLSAAAQFQIYIKQFTEHQGFIPRMTVGDLADLQLKVVVGHKYCGIEIDTNEDNVSWDRGLAFQKWAAFVDSSIDGKLNTELKQNGVENMIRRRTRDPVTDPFDLEQKSEILCLDDSGSVIDTLDGFRQFEPKR